MMSATMILEDAENRWLVLDRWSSYHFDTLNSSKL